MADPGPPSITIIDLFATCGGVRRQTYPDAPVADRHHSREFRVRVDPQSESTDKPIDSPVRGREQCLIDKTALSFWEMLFIIPIRIRSG
jgi:hypothetical protein